MVRIAALIVIVVFLAATAPVWFFALAGLSPTFLAILLAAPVGIAMFVFGPWLDEQAGKLIGRVLHRGG